MKQTHAARAEAAAARKEEKRRQEKERILQVRIYLNNLRTLFTIFTYINFTLYN